MYGFVKVFLFEYSIHMDVPYLLFFFTTWNTIIILFHRYLYKSVNLIYLTYITCLIGTYLSLYNPGYFKVNISGETIVIDGWKKFIMADMVHLLPFLFVYCMYYTHYKNEPGYVPMVNAMLLLLIYVILANIKKIYLVPFKELLAVFVVANIFFYFVLN